MTKRPLCNTQRQIDCTLRAALRRRAKRAVLRTSTAACFKNIKVDPTAQVSSTSPAFGSSTNPLNKICAADAKSHLAISASNRLLVSPVAKQRNRSTPCRCRRRMGNPERLTSTACKTPWYRSCSTTERRSNTAGVLCEQASDKGATALLQAPHDVCPQHVAILLQESLRLVLHLTGEMPDDEVTRPILDDVEVLVFDMRLKQFGAPLLGAPADDRALVVEHRKHASFAGTDELDDGRVVWKIVRIPLHTFPSIQHRLVLENHLVEILLQQLIGEVDEELLQ
eukprot:CAMPEP_0177455680 /NCGR_PEP_ID=MMETSP0369-20130122/12042_1 /TAXON_ID=447022 ORGANISM="Scrippsiella hangoei-like, Strain SHHI-4" /NCGR_SAMPLE_ID=MMETSP0369 /ASSEMBLY_ACC=CAM_ASM_000364 /LENGTH=281 /DNA_ID=CAMNT_0018928579 /DNA_START=489 /DNA_END=1331 /DNA_ORIENTATION=-